MPLFSRSSKATNKEYEDFKKSYDTKSSKSFKLEFRRLFNAAIEDIVKFNKQTSPTPALNLASQKALIEYYVNAKLVETEILTKIAFNKLNEFSKLPFTPRAAGALASAAAGDGSADADAAAAEDADKNLTLLRALDFEKVRSEDEEGQQIGYKNGETTEAFLEVLKDDTKISHLFLNNDNDKYFIRLIALFLTIFSRWKK